MMQYWLLSVLHDVAGTGVGAGVGAGVGDAASFTCVIHPGACPVLATLLHLTQLSATPP
jgi:hypothetical protein